jgi:hypothetical protein
MNYIATFHRAQIEIITLFGIWIAANRCAKAPILWRKTITRDQKCGLTASFVKGIFADSFEKDLVKIL